MTTSQAVGSKETSQNSHEERLQIQRLQEQTLVISSNVGSDVVKGLTQRTKSLPPRYFYDDRGSELFEQICELPEYYVTRTETAILQECAGEIAQITGSCELVELGSGSSTKTRILLDAYYQAGYNLHYVPIDVSAGMLESTALQLLAEYPTLKIQALAGTYELALAQLEPTKLPTRTICFIGSTLGNLNSQECDEFFNQIINALQEGEYFLLGIDLQKPKHLLEAAYNDRQGVTAAFNLNMLAHLNRLYQGNFDITQFEHWAFYNETQNQIEMHLRSLRSQTIELQALNLTVSFDQDETILTEISRKFDLNNIQQELKAKGLVPQKVWTDKNQWFGLILCQKNW
ncbi:MULTISPECIES: L-histidine N(alpha)-methyltransferase [Nostocales]|uniref:Methyltransferase n=3 Tax=Nostocales TaxID=1161 RepID=A0A0C1N707_9CYAN|nr:L-histidine N(alpha)-methyltransferase [Tolypothrix bouteillei]KAF3885744.1 L-histidine N(alpha)-methyltransferase [Tolypothrix bouteillei VB521301]